MIQIPKKTVADATLVPDGIGRIAEGLAPNASRLREFIVRKPEASLAIGLVAGLILGAWYKR